MIKARLAALNAHFNAKRVKVTIKDRIAVVEMNPQKRLTFLAKPVLIELNQVLQELQKDDEVSVVILTGQGNSFSLDDNNREIAAITDQKWFSFDMKERYWWCIPQIFRKPFIAAVDGQALGGGLEVVMMADVLICTEDSKFGQPELNLGGLPGVDRIAEKMANALGEDKIMDM